MSSAVIDFEIPRVENSQRSPFLDLTSDMMLGGDEVPKGFPDLPSLLRKANRRYMFRIDTTKVPDFKSLVELTWDQDIFTALTMISSDAVKDLRIGGKPENDAVTDLILQLDESRDTAEIYSNIVFDELRFGNAIVQKRYEEDARGSKMMVDYDMVHPGKIVDMGFGDHNEPMWWSFRRENKENAIYLDERYMDKYKEKGVSGEILGGVDEIAHFKAHAQRYQKFGVGIGQVAKLLVETKLDMMVDFSKIVKKEAATKEYMYVNVENLDDDQAQAKIDETIESVNKQRNFGSIIVLGKSGPDDPTDVKLVGSEGKVLDNFTLHYRDDVLRAIRILTRIPASFWLGESTNKATINNQTFVYNAFLNSTRSRDSRRFRRQLWLPYVKQFRPGAKIDEIPQIILPDVTIYDPVDYAIVDDMLVRMFVKSRHQVAEERGTRLPEEDNEDMSLLAGGQSEASAMAMREAIKPSIGVDTNGIER